MDIGAFKGLTHEEKLKELKFNGNLLGPYDRNGEPGEPKTPGDIYELNDFWVFLSEDEQMVIPSRRNPLPEEEED
jgi:hypothetical protein